MISSVIPLRAGSRKRALSGSRFEASSTNSKALTNEETRQVEKMTIKWKVYGSGSFYKRPQWIQLIG